MKEKLESLLLELKLAYQKSDNRKYQHSVNKNWGYELIQTALLVNQPLIIGFNWGVDNTWEEYKSRHQYKHQVSIDKRYFMKVHMASLKRSMNLCKRKFPTIDFSNGSHSNFVFFRSEKENQISEKDINLCIPIFEKMIDIINPSVVFCFSSRARDFMVKSKLIYKKKEKKITVKPEGKRRSSFKAIKGIFKNDTVVYCLPHPNSKIRKEVREEAWKFCKEA